MIFDLILSVTLKNRLVPKFKVQKQSYFTHKDHFRINKIVFRFYLGSLRRRQRFAKGESATGSSQLRRSASRADSGLPRAPHPRSLAVAASSRVPPPSCVRLPPGFAAALAGSLAIPTRPPASRTGTTSRTGAVSLKPRRPRLIAETCRPRGIRVRTLVWPRPGCRARSKSWRAN